jgi:hypothetical protein
LSGLLQISSASTQENSLAGLAIINLCGESIKPIIGSKKTHHYWISPKVEIGGLAL